MRRVAPPLVCVTTLKRTNDIDVNQNAIDVISRDNSVGSVIMASNFFQDTQWLLQNPTPA
jgi:hypothetical protein